MRLTGERCAAVVLRDARDRFGDGYGSLELVVQLEAGGLRAVARSRSFEDGQGVAGFADKVAEGWRGWAGARSWEGDDMRIDAWHDGQRRVRMRFTLREPGGRQVRGRWAAAVEVQLAAGEELADAMAAVAALARSPFVR